MGYGMDDVRSESPAPNAVASAVPSDLTTPIRPLSSTSDSETPIEHGRGGSPPNVPRAPIHPMTTPMRVANRRLSMKGTPAWTAPEIMHDTGNYTNKVDVVRARYKVALLFGS
jgi:hypothetical protein